MENSGFCSGWMQFVFLFLFLIHQCSILLWAPCLPYIQLLLVDVTNDRTLKLSSSMFFLTFLSIMRIPLKNSMKMKAGGASCPGMSGP